MQNDLKKLKLNQEAIRNITTQLANGRQDMLTHTQITCSCRPQCETTNTIHCFGARPARRRAE